MLTNFDHGVLCVVSKPCQRAEEDQMLCRMPVVGLPDDLRHELESGQLISNTGRHGIAVYWSSHQHTRVDIYIGLKLDGLARYHNISSVRPDISIQFDAQPTVPCESDELNFNPNDNKVLSIQVIQV